MIDITGSNDIISYLSWCEANNIEPFDDNQNENENNEELNIEKEEQVKVLKKGRMIKYE